jgi:hypothetical protein
MKGEQVRVPSETKLMFALTNPVDVTIPPALPAVKTRENLVSSPGNRFEVPPQPDERPRVRRRF